MALENGDVQGQLVFVVTSVNVKSKWYQ